MTNSRSEFKFQWNRKYSRTLPFLTCMPRKLPRAEENYVKKTGIWASVVCAFVRGIREAAAAEHLTPVHSLLNKTLQVFLYSCRLLQFAATTLVNRKKQVVDACCHMIWLTHVIMGWMKRNHLEKPKEVILWEIVVRGICYGQEVEKCYKSNRVFSIAKWYGLAFFALYFLTFN